MLVLGRKLGQRIKIGDNITIHVLEQSGKSVHIGIDAPTHISIHREEIYNKIKGEEGVPCLQKVMEMA